MSERKCERCGDNIDPPPVHSYKWRRREEDMLPKNPNLCRCCRYSHKFFDGPWLLSHDERGPPHARYLDFHNECQWCGREITKEWGDGFDATGNRGIDEYISTITDIMVCRHCPVPRKCRTCYEVFPSGGALFRHIKENLDHCKA